MTENAIITPNTRGVCDYFKLIGNQIAEVRELPISVNHAVVPQNS